jgi:hypothetical protein
MAIYRRLMVRMWADAKVMALSRPQPCGQALWFHLLAGEQTDIIPGLFKIGEAAFAEQLGWPLDGFRDAMQEAIGLGLVKADWKARLVFIPKAIRHNQPNGPNTVASWSDAWDRLPECALKVEAWRTLNAYFDGCGEAFKKAWQKACPMPSGMASTIQEQDQEQDQDVIVTRAREAPGPGTLPSKAGRLAEMYPCTQVLLDALAGAGVPLDHATDATTRAKVEKAVEQLKLNTAVKAVQAGYASKGKLFIGWYLDELAAAVRAPPTAEPDLDETWLVPLPEAARVEWREFVEQRLQAFWPDKRAKALADVRAAITRKFTPQPVNDAPF